MPRPGTGMGSLGSAADMAMRRGTPQGRRRGRRSVAGRGDARQRASGGRGAVDSVGAQDAERDGSGDRGAWLTRHRGRPHGRHHEGDHQACRRLAGEGGYALSPSGGRRGGADTGKDHSSPPSVGAPRRGVAHPARRRASLGIVAGADFGARATAAGPTGTASLGVVDRLVNTPRGGNLARAGGHGAPPERADALNVPIPAGSRILAGSTGPGRPKTNPGQWARARAPASSPRPATRNGG